MTELGFRALLVVIMLLAVLLAGAATVAAGLAGEEFGGSPSTVELLLPVPAGFTGCVVASPVPVARWGQNMGLAVACIPITVLGLRLLALPIIDALF